MKNLFLILAIASLSLLQKVEAAMLLPHLADVRVEITNQLTIASNAPTLDKKLVTSLRKALTLIDKGGKTNVANDLKTFGLVAKTLNRTSVSNEFQTEFATAISAYFNLLGDAALSSSNRLNSTFPGRLRDAAENALAKVFASIQDASATTDVVAEAKLLGKTATALVKADAAVDRAENAPLPPTQFRASVDGAVHGDFNFTPSPAPAVATYNIANNTLTIAAFHIKAAGGVPPRITQRGLTLVIPDLVDGTTTYNVAPSGGNAIVIYQASVGGEGDVYNGTSGTVTVTVNKANRTAVGTFNFSGAGSNDPGTVASSNNGSFSVVWIE